MDGWTGIACDQFNGMELTFGSPVSGTLNEGERAYFHFTTQNEHFLVFDSTGSSSELEFFLHEEKLGVSSNP